MVGCHRPRPDWKLSKELTAGVPSYRMFQAESLVAGTEAHVALHGTLPPPSLQGTKANPSYTWLQTRRLQGDAQDFGELEPRITALLALPGRTDAVSEARLAELTAYVDAHSKLPTGFHDGPVYHWLRTQRARYRQGKLIAERAAALRAINGVLPRRGPGRPKRPAGK
jgi:hypothetical protein